MTDKVVDAKTAVSKGFANDIIEELKDEPDWFDLNKVPAIGKLLNTDYATLINCKKLLNQAKPNYEQLFQREAKALYDVWLHPDFE